MDALIKKVLESWPAFLIAALLLVTGHKRLWIFGYQLDSCNAERVREREESNRRYEKLEAERNEWKALALRGGRLAKQALETATILPKPPV